MDDGYDVVRPGYHRSPHGWVPDLPTDELIDEACRNAERLQEICRLMKGHKGHDRPPDEQPFFWEHDFHDPGDF